MNMDLKELVKKPSYSLCYDPLRGLWLLTSVFPSGHDRQDYIRTQEAHWYVALGAKDTTTPGVWVPHADDVFKTHSDSIKRHQELLELQALCRQQVQQIAGVPNVQNA